MATLGAASQRLQLREVSIPQRDSRCELMNGDTPTEQAERLADRLRELKVI
jgi:hypothetical protein